MKPNLVCQRRGRSRAVAAARVLVCLMMVAAVASCTKIPDFPKGVTVARMVYNIRCELRDGLLDVAQRHPWMLNWAGGFTMRVNVFRENNGSVDASILVPVNISFYRVKLSGGLNKGVSRSQLVNIMFTDLKQVVRQECPSPGIEGEPRLLAGDLGLRRWIGTIGDQIAAARVSRSVIAMTYSVSFSISTNASISPDFEILKGSGDTFGGVLDLSRARTQEHAMIFAIARNPDDIDLKVDLSDPR